MCLLEDLIEGEVDYFIKEKRSRWSYWFNSMRPWKDCNIVIDRVVWVRILGIPCQACGNRFFKSVVNKIASFIKSDESTTTKLHMDVEQISLRTS